MSVEHLRPLSDAATDTLWCLFAHGPTEDGNLPSKSGRFGLVGLGFAECGEGWNWITRDGVNKALAMGFDRKKEREQRDRRIPR